MASGKLAVQVRINTPTSQPNSYIETMTWVDVALKPKAGMALVCPPDPRVWTVIWAGTLTNEFTSLASWKQAKGAAA